MKSGPSITAIAISAITVIAVTALLRIQPRITSPAASPRARPVIGSATPHVQAPFVLPAKAGTMQPAPPPDSSMHSASRTGGDAASLRARVEHLLVGATARERYQAFVVLARCAHAIEFARYLQALPAGRDTARLRERWGDGPARVALACGDLSPRDVEQRVELAAAAADAGVPGAAAAWIEEGPYGDRSALTQRPDDPLITAWVAQAIERVRTATRRSDTEAIGQFGLLCLNWELDDVARVRLLVDAGQQRRHDDEVAALLR